MSTLKQSFPEGVDYRIVYDPTTFVRNSIRAVVETLFEAILLVVIVVMVFLQTWRASIIPLVAVPVSLIGTFAVMLAMGFSLNTLSLFGLVLSIGIVVDDAIVVVENVERHIELGLPPLDATRRAMEEVSGPIIAIALVLCAVFVPTAFVSGLSGQFYRQFALTIAISTVISAFNSLTLSPALASRLLKPHGAPRDVVQRTADRLFGWFFRGFNGFFTRASGAYTQGVGRVLRVAAVAIVLYRRARSVSRRRGSRGCLPDSCPTQDKEYLVAFAQLPDGATLDRTDAVIRKMSSIALEHPGVLSSVAFPGLSINGFVNQPNAGIAFVVLKPSEERTSKDLSAGAIVQALNGQFFGQIQEAVVAIFPPPPVQGLGTVGGFKLYVEDRAGARLRGSLRTAAGQHGQGAAGAIAGWTLLELSGQRASDRCGRRSRAGEELRRGVDGRLRDAAGLSRVALRERLQSIRTHLSGQRAGRVRLPSPARTDPPSRDAQRAGRDGAARIARHRQAQLRARSGHALQRLPRRGDQRRPVARLQLGSGTGGDRGRPPAAVAVGDDLRVDGAGLPGAAGGKHDAARLPALRAARLRRARGAIRELVAAADRDPDRPDDVVLGHCRCVADRRRQQRVHADQLSRACRARVQERDPDRGVREAARGRRASRRSTRS